MHLFRSDYFVLICALGHIGESFQRGIITNHRCVSLDAHHVRISYCPGCKWMLRSAYYAQEILSTFDDGRISEVTLAPNFEPPGGEFIVSVDDTIVWNRREDNGFPGAAELKRRIRDIINPEASLGHSDKFNE
mmetsp:Transcript_3644/g.4793  ORF Transcript_3644/g.4793 Transcript_3644/m.4793 type:complete len:133 (+) Transcript_3644:2-400(+)